MSSSSSLHNSALSPVLAGAAIGLSLSVAVLLAMSQSIGKAKAKSGILDPNTVQLAHRTSRRQHVVFLLGAPLMNRTIVAQRLTRNRHLAVEGGPLALEFDECVPDNLRDLIQRGVPLSDAQIDEMIDAVIVRVQQVADERPVIFSAFLPIRRLRQRFFSAFDDKTIIRLVVADEPPDTPRGAVQRLSSTNSLGISPPGVIDDKGAHDDSKADVVAVPEIDDKFDQTWQSENAELGLEALAMLDKAADEELRKFQGDNNTDEQLRKMRKRLAFAWLNGQFEEIAPEHHRVDATRTLHEVAREVRTIVQSQVLACSKRKNSVIRARAAPPVLHRWGDLGGVRGIVSVCAAGTIAGGAIGALRTKLWD